MKNQATIPQIVRIIHEELSVRGQLADAEDAVVGDDARYQKVPDIEGEYWDREEQEVIYIPEDYPRRAEAETAEDLKRRDAAPSIVPNIPLPGSDLPPGAVPRAFGVEEYIPELPDDVIPDAADTSIPTFIKVFALQVTVASVFVKPHDAVLLLN